MFRHAAPVFRSAAQRSLSTQTTSLDNGLRVVSIDNDGPVSSLGLFFNAGSRHENPSALGTSHVLTRLATQSTFNRSSVRLIHDIECTGDFAIRRGRELTSISANVPRTIADSLASLILDVARPRCLEYELRDIAEPLREDTTSALSNPNTLLEDELHSAAYRGSQLGHSLYARGAVSQAQMIEYLFSNWKPEHCVFAGVNVNHDELLSAINKEQDAFKNHVEGFVTPRSNAPSTYHGGESRQVGAGTALRLAVGLKGLSHAEGGNDLQHVITYLLQNQVGCSWKVSSHSYSDSGLISFSTATASGNGSELFSALSSALRGSSFSNSQVEKAKQAVIVSNFTANNNAFGQLSRVALGEGNVEAVTADQVNNAVRNILSSGVTLASQGNLADVPSAASVQSNFA
mmetsp:Transcript_9465/g.12750  ORF Transcript_9465/g.12750 Transcript_9465/m.12750 type:complete len:403 (+) Transcript_9465:136-1344(+)|eukprot:CAMPEP_0201492048 /NCGR_PEP_ID=MMETSP0151_2-20130828/32038_1 /ASSEMBLY_ACC=CAM_ASM_000257 /TAXON_ID=200890 /ORGANISM="Paramoeba atlantica, Strain 621/1 / CCAP 1560/9" /LENGTH=402 /DNA_ID=CAMNT_0047878697 /DNA_START=133 /DNA_END=1341 /DNA_ORIENTATION=+